MPWQGKAIATNASTSGVIHRPGLSRSGAGSIARPQQGCPTGHGQENVSTIHRPAWPWSRSPGTSSRPQRERNGSRPASRIKRAGVARQAPSPPAKSRPADAATAIHRRFPRAWPLSEEVVGWNTALAEQRAIKNAAENS